MEAFAQCRYINQGSTFTRDNVFDTALTVLDNIVKLNTGYTGVIYCVWFSCSFFCHKDVINNIIS